jgi:hypothetical protein
MFDFADLTCLPAPAWHEPVYPKPGFCGNGLVYLTESRYRRAAITTARGRLHERK